jgi:uncharacterized repeat protein (TIGR03803 family)
MNKFNLWLRVSGALLLWSAAAVALPAQTFTTLHNFDATDGENPLAGLVQGTNGNLYGTTNLGGANGGHGTVFKITPSGTLTTLHSFDGTDGEDPYAGLVQGANGDLYGTTQGGGANNDGTVFKITPRGRLTTLHSFDGTDGEDPYAGLVQGANGDLYGTTQEGGANNDGTVFRITASGELTSLHNFDGTDGQYPGGLVQATDGNFFGTTLEGGANGESCFGSSCGTVFKITPSGKLTTLHSFDLADGAYPLGTLVQDTNGDFYGTTQGGGATNDGTVFSITATGKLTTLHSFAFRDGESPMAGLVQGTDGNLYGTTFQGGATGGGTVFSITPGGRLTTLYNFCPLGFPCTHGDGPQAGLIQATNGKFYGTTENGGAYGNYGTVFSLNVDLK